MIMQHRWDGYSHANNTLNTMLYRLFNTNRMSANHRNIVSDCCSNIGRAGLYKSRYTMAGKQMEGTMS